MTVKHNDRNTVVVVQNIENVIKVLTFSARSKYW